MARCKSSHFFLVRTTDLSAMNIGMWEGLRKYPVSLNLFIYSRFLSLIYTYITYIRKNSQKLVSTPLFRLRRIQSAKAGSDWVIREDCYLSVSVVVGYETN